MELFFLSILYVLINLPFGYLRGGVPKRSVLWFLYIHLPIPLLVFLRLVVFKVHWHYIPLLVGCYALGQWGGGRLRRRSPSPR